MIIDSAVVQGYGGQVVIIDSAVVETMARQVLGRQRGFFEGVSEEKLKIKEQRAKLQIKMQNRELRMEARKEMSSSHKCKSVLVAVVVFLFGSVVYGQPWDGNGVDGDPYQIWTAEDMQAIGADANYWDAHFKLMADIDLGGYTGTSFNIIGNDVNAFTGAFDGNEHTISNFAFSGSGTDSVGIFGCVDGQYTEIKSLGLRNPKIHAYTSDNVGSFIGKLNNGTLSYCWVESGNVIGNWHIGGLVGETNFDGKIFYCYSDSNVAGSGNYDYDYVGAIVGRNHGTIYGSSSAGTVQGKGARSIAGGLAGSNSYGNILNSYSTTSVTGAYYVGGLVGLNMSYGYSGYISNCYSTGKVKCSGTCRFVGGLVGDNYVGYEVILNSFWDIETSEQLISDGGIGLLTAQMQDPNTFMSAGWDFVGETGNGPADVWAQRTEGGYPLLWWQMDPVPPLPSFSGGLGQPNNPYLISDANELNSIGCNHRLMDAHFKMVNNIDLAGVRFFSIGNKVIPFKGVFDGNDHTISYFTFISTATDYIGLFRYVDGPDMELRNITLADPNISAGSGDYVGSLVGFLTEGTVRGCFIRGGGVSGTHSIGGLVGRNNNGVISKCSSETSVSGNHYVGGLVGFYGYGNKGNISDCCSIGNISGNWNVGGLVGGNNNGDIFYSYAAGNVTGTGQKIGGLVGNDDGGNISNCSSRADVTGGADVGGLVGECYYGSNISNSNATGNVKGGGRVGGLVGTNEGNVVRSYSTGAVTGTDSSYYLGGLVGRHEGRIFGCYSKAIVTGYNEVGGLAGKNGGEIVNCYARGEVYGNWEVGGLVGDNAGKTYTSYSTGKVAGNSDIGGLAGKNMGSGSVILASFWDVSTSQKSNMCGHHCCGSIGCDNAAGKTTSEMQTESTFTDAGWDFVTPIWTIDEGDDYPRLWWENDGPVSCIVGGDRVVEADSNCEAVVVLDGSCSSDDINDFEWYVVDSCDPNYEDYLGSGEVIECNLPLGENIIVLEVTDTAGDFDSNEVTITVEDVTPPEFSLAVEPNVLWPPNHKMVLITVEWEVSDNCDDEPEVRLVGITSSEDDDGKGDGATSDDIVIGEDGSIYLRAESVGYLEGRVYTITYEAVDDSGNTTLGSAEVLVPDGYRWRHLEHKGEGEGTEE